MRHARRRLVLGGTAALVLKAIRNALWGPQPVRAARSKPVTFDISASQFRDDCLEAGGDFADMGDGEYICCFPGWCMECSKVTKSCRIVCDPGVKCIKASRLPGHVQPALDHAVNQLAPVANAPASGPSHDSDVTMGDHPTVSASE